MFASPRFTAFHRNVMEELLREDRLRLHWLEIEGVPAAAEYCLAGADTVYSYQSGLDPRFLVEEPGRIAKVGMLQLALAEGRTAFDLLRGDEYYKSHWRAEPVPCLEVRIVPRRAAARLRHNVWIAGGKVKRWMKKGADEHTAADASREWQRLGAADGLPLELPVAEMPASEPGAHYA